MCNLYNLTTNHQAIRDFVSITHDLVGNLEPSIDVYPDRLPDDGANVIVEPIHQKAMPVILTTKDEIGTWLTAPWAEARALQRPLPGDKLKIVQVAENLAPANPQEALLF